MKKAIAITLVFVLSFALIAGCSQPSSTSPSAAPSAVSTTQPTAAPASAAPEPEPITIIGGDNAGVGAAAQLCGEAFSDKIEELSGGKITVEYYPNSVLGNDQELQQQMLDGDIQFVVCQTAQTTNFVPQVAIFDLPMVFAAYDATAIDEVLNKSAFKDKMDEYYNEKGFDCLGYLQGATYRQTTSNVALYTIDDFQGLNIRTMENKYHMAFWSAWGANPTPLPWSETYLALQQGVVDAQENATDTVAGNRLYEVQKYLCMTNHILYCNQLLYSKEAYDSLDPAYQAIITEAADYALGLISEQLTKINDDNLKVCEDNGMTVITYDDAFFTEMIEKVQGVYDTIGQDVGADLVDLLQSELQSAK